MKKLLLLALCALPLSAMQNPKEELLKAVKSVKSHQVDGCVQSAALGGFAGYTITNACIMSIVGSTIVSIPAVAAGAGVGLGARYLYNKYTLNDLKGK